LDLVFLAVAVLAELYRSEDHGKARHDPCGADAKELSDGAAHEEPDCAADMRRMLAS